MRVFACNPVVYVTKCGCLLSHLFHFYLFVVVVFFFSFLFAAVIRLEARSTQIDKKSQLKIVLKKKPTCKSVQIHFIPKCKLAKKYFAWRMCLCVHCAVGKMRHGIEKYRSLYNISVDGAVFPL